MFENPCQNHNQPLINVLVLKIVGCIASGQMVLKFEDIKI